jgi:hypothetical protein
MALASEGASTPFFTRALSSAATLASLAVVTTLTLGLGLGLGLAAAGLASALGGLAEFSFAVFASLVPAITGTAMMATIKRLDNHIFSFNIKRCLLPVADCIRTWSAILRFFRSVCHDFNHTGA